MHSFSLHPALVSSRAGTETLGYFPAQSPRGHHGHGDFFTVPTLTLRVLYCFFIIEHDRRKILHFNVTEHPTVPSLPALGLKKRPAAMSRQRICRVALSSNFHPLIQGGKASPLSLNPECPQIDISYIPVPTLADETIPESHSFFLSGSPYRG
jgi:hypothetical protein